MNGGYHDRQDVFIVARYLGGQALQLCRIARRTNAHAATPLLGDDNNQRQIAAPSHLPGVTATYVGNSCRIKHRNPGYG